MALDVIPIVLTVATSIVQIAAFCIAGYIAAIRGIVDYKCRRQLNRLNIGIFTPALVFGKVAFFLTPEKLAELWIIPASFAILTFFSFASAWCLGKIFRLSRLHLNVTVAGAMFMNTNTIPIALIQSLSLSLDKLKINSLDTPDKELGRAFSYLAVYSLLGSLLRWSYGVKLLQPSAKKDPETTKSYVSKDCEKVDFPLSEGNDAEAHIGDGAIPEFVDLAVPTRTQGAYRISCATAFSSDSDLGALSKPNNARFSYPTAFAGAYSNLLGPSGTRKGTLRMSSATTFSVDSEITRCDVSGDTYKERRKSYHHGPLPLPETQAFNEVAIFFDEPPRLQPIWENQPAEAGEANSSAAPEKATAALPTKGQRAKRWKKLNLAQRFRVPTWVMSFIETDFFCVGYRDCLHPPTSALAQQASDIEKFSELSRKRIHSNHAGSFFSSSTSHQNATKSVKDIERASQSEAASKKPSKHHNTTIALALISRHLITPLILLPLMYILARFVRVTIFADPIFLLTTVLLVGAPPAITLSQMATEQDEDLDKLVSRLLFWSFVFITPLTTLLLVGIAILIHDVHQG
ncbi:hypothetical protein PtB15_11B143 [Puccinia triticina]|nr:hypothetical protein PtB15_11B143 [Puccinia triticina]